MSKDSVVHNKPLPDTPREGLLLCSIKSTVGKRPCLFRRAAIGRPPRQRREKKRILRLASLAQDDISLHFTVCPTAQSSNGGGGDVSPPNRASPWGGQADRRGRRSLPRNHNFSGRRGRRFLPGTSGRGIIAPRIVWLGGRRFRPSATGSCPRPMCPWGHFPDESAWRLRRPFCRSCGRHRASEFAVTAR